MLSDEENMVLQCCCGWVEVCRPVRFESGNAVLGWAAVRVYKVYNGSAVEYEEIRT